MSAPDPLFGEYPDAPLNQDLVNTQDSFYFIFGCYFGILLGVGWAAWRKKNAEARSLKGSNAELKSHYGGTYPPVLIALTVFSSAFSGYTVVGVPQTTLDNGWLVLMFFAGTAAQSIGMLIFFPRLRRLGMARGYISPNDFVADRYRHKGITILVVLAASLPQFIYLAVQLASFGETLNTLTYGLVKKSWGMGVCAVVMLTMELLGGMHSVVLTDIVQAIIMLTGFALLIAVMQYHYDVFNLGAGCTEKILENADGILNCRANETGKTWDVSTVAYGCLESATTSGLVGAQLNTPFVDLDAGTVFMASFWWFMMNFFTFSCNPHLIQRLFLAEKDSGIKSVAQLLIFSPFVAMGPGLLAGLLVAANWVEWGPELACRGSAFAVLANHVGQKGMLEEVLVTLLAVAALAAIMSSADSVILGVSNSWCIDIYRNMCSPNASTQCVVRIGQAISVFMCAVCLYFADNINGGTFANWLSVQNGILLQLGPAVYYGLHRDYHPRAIFNGLVVGMLALIPVMYFQMYPVPIGENGLNTRAIFTLIAGPSFCAMVNFVTVWITQCCCTREEYTPAETAYTGELSLRFQDDRLTTEKIAEIMEGTVEPNRAILTIALVMLPLTVPFYSWDAQIGIFPGWALMSFVMIFLCTFVVFLASCSWKPKDNDDGEEITRRASVELQKLGSALHIDQARGAAAM